MSQPETRLCRKIREAIKARGCYVVKFHGGEYGVAGVPDLLCCVEGDFVGLEVKTLDKRANVSPRQQLDHERIRRAGGCVAVVCSVREALEVVERVRKAAIKRRIVTQSIIDE